MCTVKPETLMSGNFDEFGESQSSRQTLTFQSKAIAISKISIHLKQKYRIAGYFRGGKFSRIGLI